MGIAEKLNGLNGSVVTRQQLQAHVRIAKNQEQFHIAEKLQSILDAYPKKQSFEFEIVKPQIDVVPNSFLQCLDCEQTEEDFNGLAKAVSPNDIYQMITDKMIVMIKDAKSSDYKKKWKSKQYGKGYTIPFNFVSGKRYRGVNILLLTELDVLENPYFLTFKQVEELKGSVVKGAKGHPVVYFTQLFKVENSEKNIDFGTYDRKRANDYAAEVGVPVETIPILKYYNVFNGKDITGIDFDLENFKVGFIDKDFPADEEHRMQIPEAIVSNYPKPAPSLKFGGDRAFYSPSKDFIQMPFLSDFETVQDYYRTLLHEFSHSTGNPKRLKRDFSGTKGSKAYAFEELVAELGATFLSAEAGIIWHNNVNHASYLKGWNRVLTHIENDNRFIMKAATLSQKLTDYVLQFDEAGNPLYFNDLKKQDEVKAKTPVRSDEKKLRTIKPKSTVPAVEKKTGAKAETTVLPGANKISESHSNKTRIRKKKVIDPNQLALLGTKEKLNAPIFSEVSELPVKEITIVHPEIIEPEQILKPIHSSNKIQKIGSSNNQQSEFYTVSGEVGKFLQQVEKKPFGSVVMTMDGEQGAGKTTMLYQCMESFASVGNKCLFISGEEDPNSHLAKSKTEKYISEEAKANLDTVGEVSDVSELYSFIEPYDVIFIDSWQKLLRMVGNLRLDEDLRKKFHGKVFVIIFQQTTTGRTKGGAEVVFDGDIIIKMVKEASFELNYAYFDKNRYTLIPIETIRYNIAKAKCYNPEEKQTEIIDTENVKLSFEYQEK